MSYKIAIATSDEKQINENFGLAKSFIIYEVTNGAYRKLEERVFNQREPDKDKVSLPDDNNRLSGCSNGAGGGCDRAGEVSAKVELVSDCRCVVCKKIGLNMQKQLERKAISVFDVCCSIEEALNRISHYFSRIDNHESLNVQR